MPLKKWFWVSCRIYICNHYNERHFHFRVRRRLVLPALPEPLTIVCPSLYSPGSDEPFITRLVLILLFSVSLVRLTLLLLLPLRLSKRILNLLLLPLLWLHMPLPLLIAALVIVDDAAAVSGSNGGDGPIAGDGLLIQPNLSGFTVVIVGAAADGAPVPNGHRRHHRCSWTLSAAYSQECFTLPFSCRDPTDRDVETFSPMAYSVACVATCWMPFSMQD